MKDKTYFDISASESTGGVTGSMKVKGADGNNYQLKPSILDNTFIRQLKAGKTDRENFGEFIASTIAREILNQPDQSKPSPIPEVFLVYDKAQKRVLIASKYLQANQVRTLDSYAEEMGTPLTIVGKKKTHVKIIESDTPKENEMSINAPATKEICAGLAHAVAVSSILGDHDINPGNIMILTTEENKIVVARIDFGHAFNDLLNAPKIMGGTVLNKENPIKDFLNREKIAGIKGGDQSKLRRDYPALILSKELADAYITQGLTPDENILHGIRLAQKYTHDLFQEMHQNNDDAGYLHIQNTLLTICNNISTVKTDSRKNILEQVDDVFDEIRKFVLNNRDNALKIGYLMQTQLIIDKRLAEGRSAEEIKNELGENIPKPFLPTKSTIWIREPDRNKPIYGNVDQYILQRKTELIYNSNPNDRANNVTKGILDGIDNYRDKIESQHGLSRTGLAKATLMVDQLHRTAEQFDKGDIAGARVTIADLKYAFVQTFGQKKAFGKTSDAFNLISNIENSIKAFEVSRSQRRYKNEIQSLSGEDKEQSENYSPRR